MITTLQRSDLHCPSPAVLCLLKFLLLYLAPNPAYMLWAAVYNTGACIPGACLKLLVICLANALLATGWLLVSVLSIVGELLPKVFGMPPTMPRLPSQPVHPVLPLPKSKREANARSQARTLPEPGVPREVASTLDNDVPQRSPAAPVDAKDDKSTQSPQLSPYPRSNDSGSPEGMHSSASSKNRPFPPAMRVPDHPSQTPAEVARGRKLSFFRKHLSASRGSAKRSPPRRVCSVGELVESPEQSPERSEQIQPLSIKRCMKPSRSAEFSPKVPVPRTDPYQAPYFFPSPLSPDAQGYTSRVRSERVASPPTEIRTRGGATVSTQVTPRISASPPPESPSDAQPVASSSRGEMGRRKSPRRSWHVSFKHELQRPTSWTSDTTTVVSAGSHPGDPSDISHLSSPSASRRSSQIRRGSGGVLSPLNDIDSDLLEERQPSQRTTPTLDGERPIRRKSWNFPFRHRRADSDISHGSSLIQPLSDHGVDKLPEPRARPKLHRR